MLKCQHEVGEFIEFNEKQCNVKLLNEYSLAKALQIHPVPSPPIQDLQPVCLQPTAKYDLVSVKCIRLYNTKKHKVK